MVIKTCEQIDHGWWCILRRDDQAPILVVPQYKESWTPSHAEWLQFEWNDCDRVLFGKRKLETWTKTARSTTLYRKVSRVGFFSSVVTGACLNLTHKASETCIMCVTTGMLWVRFSEINFRVYLYSLLMMKFDDVLDLPNQLTFVTKVREDLHTHRDKQTHNNSPYLGTLQYEPIQPSSLSCVSQFTVSFLIVKREGKYSNGQQLHEIQIFNFHW